MVVVSGSKIPVLNKSQSSFMGPIVTANVWLRYSTHIYRKQTYYSYFISIFTCWFIIDISSFCLLSFCLSVFLSFRLSVLQLSYLLLSLCVHRIFFPISMFDISDTFLQRVRILDQWVRPLIIGVYTLHWQNAYSQNTPNLHYACLFFNCFLLLDY